MRTRLAHRYFDNAHSIVVATITHDLPPLTAAVERLLTRFDHHPETPPLTHPDTQDQHKS